MSRPAALSQPLSWLGVSGDPLDRITHMAERCFGVSTAIVDTERVWSRSSRGLEAEHVRRRHMAIAPGTPFVVEDATAQPGFSAPVVADAPRPRFYAGVALRTADGASLGTLCLIDPEPRRFSGEQLMTLVEIAAIVVDTLELRLAGQELRGLQDASLHSLILAIEAHDGPTSEHSLAVVGLARSVAAALALPAAKITEVAQVALLHDVGKIGIPDNILHKRGRFDRCERSRMRQHPVIGEKIVASLRELRHLAPAVRSAHERWGGGGYPDGLRGDAIPIASRIVFACDAYDAMTTNRSYQPASSETRALAELRDYAGTQFDPQVIERLIPIVEAKRERRPRTASRFLAEGWASPLVYG
jgi:HD domain/GAF domain